MKRVLVFSALTALLTGCKMLSTQVDPSKISTLHIVDRNGRTETIHSPDRLAGYEKTDFLAPQPYQKVSRVYGRDKKGQTHSCITSYHPNGQVKQYLEATNNRAFGIYNEWHQNGQQKIESHVIGGIADINTQAEESWLFDGVNRAWDSDGHLQAEITYVKGELEGKAFHYHPNGAVWKEIPYVKNALHGTVKVFLEDGSLLQTVNFVNGQKEGPSYRYWSADVVAFKETYHEGLLIEGEYFDPGLKKVASITGGTGFRALFGKDSLSELQAFRQGVQEGIVKIFDRQGALVRAFSVKNGEKEGEEIDYYPTRSGEEPLPKLLMTWHGGILQGPVKTWYENGQLESLKEMSQNKKVGLATVWYQNGSLMFVEEYDSDKLIQGEYFRIGEKVPASRVEKGRGIATLFHANGNFLRKITYHEGKPNE